MFVKFKKIVNSIKNLWISKIVLNLKKCSPFQKIFTNYKKCSIISIKVHRLKLIFMNS